MTGNQLLVPGDEPLCSLPLQPNQRRLTRSSPVNDVFSVPLCLSSESTRPPQVWRPLLQYLPLVIQHGNLPAAGSADRFVQRPVQFVEAGYEVTGGRQGAVGWRVLQPPSLNDTCQGISRRSRISTTR